MGKTILVTGATSGFGKAIATRFAKEGYTVCITGRRAGRLDELKAWVQADAGRKKQYAADIATAEKVIAERR